MALALEPVALLTSLALGSTRSWRGVAELAIGRNLNWKKNSEKIFLYSRLYTLKTVRAGLWHRHCKQMPRAYNVEGVCERWLQNILTYVSHSQSVTVTL